MLDRNVLVQIVGSLILGGKEYFDIHLSLLCMYHEHASPSLWPIPISLPPLKIL